MAPQRLSPETIYQKITVGSMKEQAANLTDQQKRKIAEFLGGRTLGLAESADARRQADALQAEPQVLTLEDEEEPPLTVT